MYDDWTDDKVMNVSLTGHVATKTEFRDVFVTVQVDGETVVYIINVRMDHDLMRDTVTLCLTVVWQISATYSSSGGRAFRGNSERFRFFSAVRCVSHKRTQRVPRGCRFLEIRRPIVEPHTKRQCL